MKTALECIRRGVDLFIEKPLSHSLDNLEEIKEEIKDKKIFTYISYNMRFHPVLIKLKEIINEKQKPICFKCVSTSYLPNWRKNQDYRKSYSAKKETGGGVLLDISHEFDYISWLFGEINEISGECKKKSSLEINTEDYVNANIECKTGINGNVFINSFSLKQERNIKIYYNDGFFEGDLINNEVIKINKKGEREKISFNFKRNDMFKKQINYFLDEYKKGNMSIMNNYFEALKTFKKIMEFKKACI